MATMSTNTRSITSRSFTTSVRLSRAALFGFNEKGQAMANLMHLKSDTREEDLTHPEDIAHFKKHDQEAEAAERQAALDRMPIVEHNIPQKFRRNS